MTTTHTNLALVGGEVCIVSENIPEHINTPVYNWNYNQINIFNNDCIEAERHGIRFSEIIASTAKLEGIPQLDRKHFVKPKVDVEGLTTVCLQKEGYQPLYTTRAGFKIGYNAKEAEFTRGEMFSLVVAVQNKEVVSFDDFENYINKIRPLSLPKSVTLNENNEVISVEWT